MKILIKIISVFFISLLIVSLFHSFSTIDENKIETWFTPVIWFWLVYILIKLFIKFNKSN